MFNFKNILSKMKLNNKNETPNNIIEKNLYIKILNI